MPQDQDDIKGADAMKQAPTPGPLSAEDVKLLVKGDLLRSRDTGQIGRFSDISATKPFCLHIWWSKDTYSPTHPLDGLTFIGRPDAGGWMPWSGGENPVPGQRVDAEGKNGIAPLFNTQSLWLRWENVRRFRLSVSTPVEVTIFCPECATPHIDEGEWATTRQHKTHQCQSCGHEWRPFSFATVGVPHPTRLAPTAPVEASGSEREALIERLCVAMQDGVGCTPWENSSWDRDGGVSRELVRESVRRILTALRPQPSGETRADALRAAGWSVAVHNDYRLNGEAHTFWLWTHPDGRWVKGEGRTDEDALSQCAALIRPAPVASGGQHSGGEGEQ